MSQYRREIPKKKPSRNYSKNRSEGFRKQQMIKLMNLDNAIGILYSAIGNITAAVSQVNNMFSQLSQLTSSMQNVSALASSVNNQVQCMSYSMDSIRDKIFCLGSLQYIVDPLQTNIQNLNSDILKFRDNIGDHVQDFVYRVEDMEAILDRIKSIEEDPVISKTVSDIRLICERLGE